MARPSSIDREDEAIRSEIGRLRIQGATLDEILAALRGAFGRAPSRSALGRHVMGLNKIAERVRRSRDVAQALARELGDAPESHAARANIELLHGAILDLNLRAADADAGDGTPIDEDGRAALNGNPEGMMMIAKALDHLGSASKKNEEFLAKVEARAEARAREAAAKAMTTVARERGVQPDTIEAIKRAVFGVAA